MNPAAGDDDKTDGKTEDSEQPGSRRAAVGLTQVLATALAAALGNDLTNAFGNSRVLLTVILVGVVLIACALYYLGDIRRSVRREWHRLRAPDRVQPDRRPDVSPILSPEPPPPAATAGRPAASAPSYRWSVIGSVVAATALGFLIGYWAIGEAFAQGRATGSAVVAGLVVLAAVFLAWARARGPAWLAWLRPRRNSMLAIGVVALGLSAGGTLGSATLSLPAQCRPPVELRVLASTEILGPLQRAITDFEQREGTVLGTSCYGIDITAYAEASDKTADQDMAGSWNLAADGPRPDIWIPASTEELPTGSPGAGQPGIDPRDSVATSPVVIAVPSDDVSGELAKDESDASIGAIYQAVSSRFSITLPNPRLSETGRLGIAGLYSSLGGTLSQIARSGGFPPDSGTLLCQATQAPQGKPPAYLVSAAAVYASAQGGLDASGCSSAQAGALTVLTPVGGPALDFPFTTVTWSGAPASPDVTNAEDAFYQWLRPRAKPGPLTSDGLASPSGAANLPSAEAVSAAVKAFTSTQPPARILVAIDGSLPMQRYLGQIEQAVDGVLGPDGQGGNLSAGRDNFGIWTFPGAAGRTEQQLVGLGPDSPGQRASVQRAVAAIAPRSHSAEFDLVADAASHDSGANSMVLLTDGDNRASDAHGNNILSVTRQLGILIGRGTPFKVYVIAFGPAGCAETPSGSPLDSLSGLARAGGGSCAPAASGSAPLQQQLAQDISTLSTGG